MLQFPAREFILFQPLKNDYDNFHEIKIAMAGFTEYCNIYFIQLWSKSSTP